MHLQTTFDVKRPRTSTAEIVARDETLPALFPDAKTEIIERKGNRRTLRTHYRALGRDGTATFRFQFLPEGEVRFEKICDGNIWRSLEGEVRAEVVDERMTRIVLSMEGRTRAFVPELTIRAPMREQISQMAKALRAILETH